jgi:hypothetical protein
MGRGHVQPCGKTRKTCTLLLHPRDGLRRDQFGALAAKQIRKGNHEVFDAVILGELGKICGHWLSPSVGSK